MLARLAHAIEQRTGHATAVDGKNQSFCKKRDRCAAEIFDNSGAAGIVFVRAFAVPTRIRVMTELHDRGDRVVRMAQVDLAHPSELWSSGLDALATALFPYPRDLTPPIEPEGALPLAAGPGPDLRGTAPEPSRLRWPWWLIGSGIAMGGAAIWVGLADGADGPAVPASAQRAARLSAYRMGSTGGGTSGVPAGVLGGAAMILVIGGIAMLTATE
jgi:hypothetical protein